VKCEQIDARSDLYSVGVSLYEMVTGQKPSRATVIFRYAGATATGAAAAGGAQRGLACIADQIILMALSKEQRNGSSRRMRFEMR